LHAFQIDERILDKRIDIVKNYISNNYYKKLKIQDIADILNLSPVYTGALFKKYTGMSINEYINHIRINQAVSIMSSTNCTISETAYMCGFEDIFYFSRVFKKIKGVSPSVFKARNL